MNHLGRAAVPLLLLLAPAIAGADPVTIALTTNVPYGKRPSITVKAVVRVTNLLLELKRGDDGPQVTVKVPSLGAGQAKQFPIGDGALGRASWSGTLSLSWGAGESWSGSFNTDTMVTQEIRIGYQRDHLDLERHVLEFQISRPSRELAAELTVLGDQGETIGEGQGRYTDVPAGKWLAIPWTPTSEAKVMMMKLHVSDPGGFVDQILTPWSISIPHDEVNFATNSAVIAPGEAPKLDAAYEAIMAEVTKAEKLGVRCSLFVSGHTDTVGPRDKNQKLSVERAKSIAGYLRQRGLTIKVAYEGFGEDRPKVQTVDETDEPRNRRADYVLSAEAPPSLGQVFRWKEVR